MRFSKIPVLLVFIIAFFLAREKPQAEFDFDSYDLPAQFKKLIPDASSVEEANYLTSWSKIYDTEGYVIGKYILTSPFCDNIKGYGGSIKLAILADEEEKISGIYLVDHRETPAWISGLENISFFNSWNGKKIEEISDHQVDVVTGATYTTTAVKDIISKRVGIFSEKTLYYTTVENAEIKWFGEKHSMVLLFILFVSFIATFVKKINKYRIYIHILSIIYFGVISGKFISIYFLENLSVNGIGILTSWTTIFLLGFSIIIPLVLNKHYYCYYICPFGGVQTILGKIPVKKIRIVPRVVRFFRVLRLLIFVMLLVAISASLKMNTALVEPFSVFVFSSASMITIIGSFVIFIASVFIKNPWCVYLCPTGQFYDLLKDGFQMSKKNRAC